MPLLLHIYVNKCSLKIDSDLYPGKNLNMHFTNNCLTNIEKRSR
jgi:hypothetical protein